MKWKSTLNEMRLPATILAFRHSKVFRSKLKWLCKAVVFASLLLTQQTAEAQLDAHLCACGQIVYGTESCPADPFFYRDADNDGYGDPNVSTQSCFAPPGYVENAADCDDNNAAINPSTVWYRDADNDGYSDGTKDTSCNRPISFKLAIELIDTTGDCNDANLLIHPGTYYADADGDGYGNPNNKTSVCSFGAPSGYVTNNTDCDDGDPNVHTSYTYYMDSDGDGFGDPAHTTTVCSSTPPAGYVTNNSDCDDTKVLYIDADGDGYGSTTTAACGIADNTDCNDNDGSVHTGITYYADQDGDGFGDPNNTITICFSRVPPGYVTDHSDCDDKQVFYADADGDGFGAGFPIACGGVGNNTDCNDNNSAINPATVWYLDADNDGYYTGSGVPSCTSPGTGYKYTGLSGGGDCNDNNANINPGKVEICGNGIDDNCNGQIDEGCSTIKTVTINDVNVTEGGTAMLRVSLSSASAKAIQVSYTTKDGTAVSGGKNKDYISVKGTLTIPANSLTGFISVSTISDTRIEGSEYFSVVLSKPNNGAVLGKSSGRVTINDPGVLTQISASNHNLEVIPSEFTIQALPNPTSDQFTLIITSGSDNPVTVRIMDMLGRSIEIRSNVASNSSLWFGSNYRPGMYLVRVVQDNKIKTLKVVKQVP